MDLEASGLPVSLTPVLVRPARFERVSPGWKPRALPRRPRPHLSEICMQTSDRFGAGGADRTRLTRVALWGPATRPRPRLDVRAGAAPAPPVLQTGALLLLLTHDTLFGGPPWF